MLMNLGTTSWTNTTCESVGSTSYDYYATADRTVAEDLLEYGAACCGSLGKTRCLDGSNMCKFEADFNPSAIATTVSVGGTDHNVPCDGTTSVARQILSVLSRATGRGLLSTQWSDLTCADMTTNMTAHFNREHSHHLYLKGTMAEFFEAYGATCCGSLGKTRDPCEVCLYTSAST